MARAHGHAKRIAVIGAGISGLSAAWLLGQAHDVVLIEAEPRLGGHANTVLVPGGDRGETAVDTGFIVYNEKTYPNFVALLAHMGVATQPTEMSFAASLDSGRLEYSGTSLAGLFAQRRNLASPRFWAMLQGLVRFYRDATRDAQVGNAADMTLGDLAAGGYGDAFRDDHLLPMAAAIWSAPCAEILGYPAEAFLRFHHNHGLLQLTDRPVWRTVSGGSARYVARLREQFGGSVRLGSPVRQVRRSSNEVLVFGEGWSERFDEVVFATHADRTLAMLADPDPLEASALGAFRYSRNHAVLHGDEALMPRRRRAWASWNHIGERGRPDAACAVTYWMNRLQDLPGTRPFFVTLNPPATLRQDAILHEEVYEHPIFDRAALAAQERLWALQGARRSWFCGAYFGAGFHEDGLQAGLAVAEALGGVRRPWQVRDESGRIPRTAPRELAA